MSVNELDAELLAMAGDESSGDESAALQDKPNLKAASPSKDAEIAPYQTKHSTARRRVDKGSKTSRRRRKSDSEEEEGEA